jgi:Tfp pilus assembly protein PilN
MVKVNLLPREDIEKHAIGKFLKWTLSYGRYIIISVELVVFLVFFSRFIYDQRLADLNERIEQKQAIVASASDFELRIRAIQHRIEQVKTLNEGRTIYLEVLEKLKTIVPVEMTFTNIEFKEETISIEGQTLTNESFAKFIIALKADELFSEIAVESVGKTDPDSRNAVEDDGPEDDIIEFTISGVIEGYPLAQPTPPIDYTAPTTEGTDL